MHRASSAGEQACLRENEGAAGNAADGHAFPREFAQPGESSLVVELGRVATCAHEQKIKPANRGTESEIRQQGGAAGGDRRLICGCCVPPPIQCFTGKPIRRPQRFDRRRVGHQGKTRYEQKPHRLDRWNGSAGFLRRRHTGALSRHRGWGPAWRDAAPKPAYDIVIVGGGGHGLATAHYLAKIHGITNVAVLEKGWIGSGNAGRNTTIIRSNYLLPGNNPFYEWSMKLWEGLKQDLNYNTMVSPGLPRSAAGPR